MENLYVTEFRRFAKSRNGFAGFVFVWVTARGEHNRDRRPLIPLDSAALDPAVDRRLRLRQHIALHAAHSWRSIGVAAALMKSEPLRPTRATHEPGSS